MKTLYINWKKIKILMIYKNVVSLAELARKSGVHRNTLMKRGSFSSHTVDKLAIYFDCQPFDFIEWGETLD